MVGLLAVVALVGITAFMPGFRPEDGDTMREFVPVALAYAAWAAATVVTLVIGWRRVGRLSDRVARGADPPGESNGPGR